MDESCRLSNDKDTHLVEISETWGSQTTDQELVAEGMFLFRNDREPGAEGEESVYYDPACKHIK